jgi:asparagine synthase (glutamine-hydrolysing)
LDSSTVVALMKKHAPGRVRTFTIGFAEDEFDESKAARSAANELGTQHTELILTPNIEETLESIAVMFDEPFGDESSIPTFFVAQLAREAVTVALSGDGGDELFGGYSRYTEALQQSRGLGRLGALVAAVGLVMPHVVPGRNRLVDLGRSDWGRYAAKVAQPVRLDEGGVARPGVPGSAVSIEEQLLGRVSEALQDDFAAAMMKLDLETYLPGDILTKVDRTSMAVSLEARVPLLDFDLVDFAFELPGALRISKNESKRLFRRAIQGIVPESVLSRPKQGFAIPLGKWFRGPLQHRIKALRNLSTSMREFVDEKAVRRLVSEHLLGRRDHSLALWRLVVLDCWLAALQDGRMHRPPSIPQLSNV